MGLGQIVALVALAVLLFVLGFLRALKYRSTHGRPPWGINPLGWGALHATLMPIGLLMYSAASRSTRAGDSSLTHRPDSVHADTPEQREAARAVLWQLPLLPAPEPAVRGWYADPLGMARFRFFDGEQWTREVATDPADRAAAAVGDRKADLERRLRALPRPSDATPSWRVDPLGENYFRFFDGERWTEEVRGKRTS
jgi:Protein of unknown function (DUF2510)